MTATNEDKNSKSVCMQKKKQKLLQLKAIFHVFVDVALIHIGYLIIYFSNVCIFLKNLFIFYWKAEHPVTVVGILLFPGGNLGRKT